MISVANVGRKICCKGRAYGRRFFLALVLVMVVYDSSASDFQSEPALPGETHRIVNADAGVEIAQGVQTPDQAVAADSNRDSLRKISILLYGLSYHPDKQGVRRDKLDNERNWGLGINYEFFEDTRGVGFIEAGAYRDSGNNLAKYAGPGYQFKFGKHWRLGAMLVGVQSRTYLQGRFFVAPIPVLTYDLGPVKLNAIYIPRYGDYNQFAAFGLMFSIPFAE